MAGTTYATVDQLAAYLDAAAPDDAARLLTRATESVQYLTRDQVPVPDDPEAADVTAAQIACRQATCALVEEWNWSGGDAPSRSRVLKSRTLSKTSETYETENPGGGNTLSVPSRVLQILRRAGLMYAGGGVL